MRLIALLHIPALIFSCEKSSFVIERNRVAKGTIIVTQPSSCLDKCIRSCQQTKGCSSVNFVLDGFGESHCFLIDRSGSPNETNALLPETVLYSAENICLNDSSSCLVQSFAFERFPNRVLASTENELERRGNIALDKCLQFCLNRTDCKASIYDQTRSLCILSNISPNTAYNNRLKFKFSESSNLYENNCAIKGASDFSGHCNWIRIRKSGLPNFFDSKERAFSVEDCENMCVSRSITGNPCRSYTFDSKKNICALNQASARLSGRSSLENQGDHLFHGDLDDCVNLSLKCHESYAQIVASTSKLFSGLLTTKANGKVVCTRKIAQGFSFSENLSFEDCGFKNKGIEHVPVYSAVVHIKEGSTNLVTARDKVIQVECRIHDTILQNKEMSVSIKVHEANQTVMSDKFISVPKRKPSKPKYSLRVLSSSLEPVSTIRASDYGWVVVNSQVSSEKFTVSKLEARDMKSGNIVRLLDDEGCAITRDLIQEIHRSENELWIQVNYTGFPSESEFVYFAFVEPCSSNCDPLCNKAIFRGTTISSPTLSIQVRNRRSSSVSYELHQDIYSIRGSRIRLLNDKSPTRNPDSVDKSEVTIHKQNKMGFSETLQHCFRDATCTVTMLLAFVQLLLLVACVLLAVCYYQEYRTYYIAQQASRNRQPIVATTPPLVERKPLNQQ